MNRRNFLSLAALAIAGKAAGRVFPFRVYSIPKEILLPEKWDQLVVPPPSLFEIPIEHLRMAQLIDGTPPAIFRSDADFENTATAALMRYQSAAYKEMMLYGNAAITPEIFGKAQKQIMDRLGTKPLTVYSYPLS